MEKKNADRKKTLCLHNFVEREKLIKYLAGILSISLSLKELICTLHALYFGLYKYIIACVEVNFISVFVIYAKN